MSTSHILLDHMQKKFEINWTKIKGGCQSGRKVETHNSKSDLPLVTLIILQGLLIKLNFFLEFEYGKSVTMVIISTSGV